MQVIRRGDYGPAVVEIRDDGEASSDTAGPLTPGHGLVGMRERVALYGGSVHAAPLPGRGFVVRAVLPLAPAVPEPA